MSKPEIISLRSYAVIVQDGKMLLCRLSSASNDPGMWTLPGGGADYGESPQDACHREVMEETGHTIELHPLPLVHSLLWNNSTERIQSVRFLFKAKVTGGTLQNEFEGSTDLATWVNIDEIATLLKADIVELALNLISKPA